MKCNMCEEGNMKYKTHNTTHIWVCSECPNVQVEYVEPKDADNIKKYLDRDDKCAQCKMIIPDENWHDERICRNCYADNIKAKAIVKIISTPGVLERY